MPDTAPPRGYVLSFDFGLRRIGVAVGQTTTCTANSLATIAHHDVPDWIAIDRLVGEWQPQLFVIGLPLDQTGEETGMSRAARAFGRALTERHGRECVYVDERLSSHAAQGRFADLRAQGSLKRKHASGLDAMAAQIVLENWLQSFDRTRTERHD